MPNGKEAEHERGRRGSRGRARILSMVYRGEVASTPEEARLVVGWARESMHMARLLLVAWAVATALGVVTTISWAATGRTRWLVFSLALTIAGAVGLALALLRRKRAREAERLNLELLQQRGPEGS